ncbi:MAG: electron transfer flavoprotein subunit beta/FixA family protein [Proteobacteria bacterium]|nr:electron transfer flavoprotein subunit beta/FixA family protein [Pseudomonadota bacterium]
MTLQIVVMVKQVPDTHNVTEEAMKADGTVNRAALPAIINPEDLNALEEALKIKDRIDAHITAITMGPAKAAEVLKECLYRGADDVVLISDRKFAGADTLATAYTLKYAIEKIGKYDLILCGRQAIDGDTAQVGPQVAEKLNINQITNLLEVVDIDEHRMTVRRAIANGYEVVRSGFPLLVTVSGEANQPRSPRAKLVMAYKNIEKDVRGDSYDVSYLETEETHMLSRIVEWNADSIGVDPAICGLAGSPTKVKKIENVVLAVNDIKQIPCTEAGIHGLMQELKSDHII